MSTFSRLSNGSYLHFYACLFFVPWHFWWYY